MKTKISTKTKVMERELPKRRSGEAAKRRSGEAARETRTKSRDKSEIDEDGTRGAPTCRRSSMWTHSLPKCFSFCCVWYGRTTRDCEARHHGQNERRLFIKQCAVTPLLVWKRSAEDMVQMVAYHMCCQSRPPKPENGVRQSAWKESRVSLQLLSSTHLEL